MEQQEEYVEISTELESGILNRADLRNMLDRLSSIYVEYPLILKAGESLVNNGMHSKFYIELKGHPDRVKNMAIELDRKAQRYGLCMHERLGTN